VASLQAATDVRRMSEHEVETRRSLYACLPPTQTLSPAVSRLIASPPRPRIGHVTDWSFIGSSVIRLTPSWGQPGALDMRPLTARGTVPPAPLSTVYIINAQRSCWSVSRWTWRHHNDCF